MLKRKLIYIIPAAALTWLAACSPEEPPPNPEETLDTYLDSWGELDFSRMHAALHEESQQEISTFDWEFTERYESVYASLGIESVSLSYDPVDYEESEEDLAELTDVTYPVDVEMETFAGTITYTTEVELTKISAEDDENAEEDRWEAYWQPEHFIEGMSSPDDVIAIRRDHPERGEIYDRNGEPLAINGEIYVTGIAPGLTDDLDATVAEYADILDMDEETVEQRATQYPDEPEWLSPVQNLSLNDDRIAELQEVEGVVIQRGDGREYPYGDITGHLIGYIGDITAEELEEREGEGYSTSSQIGKQGLESYYEEHLRGEAGVAINIENDQRESSETILETEAADGEDLHLTIDIQVQRRMAEVLHEDTGSGVVLDPGTGETLALVSEPAYDSNLRYLQLSDPRAEEMENVNVLFEYRFQNPYSPGSIFKPFTAAAAMEEGILDPGETLTIEGSEWQPDDSWGGYQVRRVDDSETKVDLTTAMTRSDNIYFARQALEMGTETFEQWGETFGFGEVLAYDYPLYASQLSSDGLDSDILLADTGYGQGQVLVTPVHMTALYTMFLNDGAMIYPTLVENGDESPAEEQLISADTADAVHGTLIDTVETSGGTAYRESPGHNRSLAGKTGTAELKSDYTEEDGEQIGWFVSYDYEEQDMVTAIMVQNVEAHGGSGYVVDLANEFWRAVSH